MRLEQKVAIVTGGGSGFGEGIAARFAQEGCRVIVNDINDEGGERVVSEIKNSGGEAVFCHGNVASSTDWKDLLTCALDNFGKLDIVINNAGTTHRNKSMLDVTDEEFDLVYDVNVKGIYYSARNLVPYFKKQGGGNFVTIASTSGIRPRPGLVWYSGSKAAAIVASQAMALELAPDKIRVNVVNPVAGDTPLLAEFMGSDTPEIREKFASVIPLGRFSQPRDNANACLYLASDEADFITGACIEVDGGRCV